jgi:hypothetical protein
VVYRPPPNKHNGFKTSTFLDDELQKVLANFTTAENNIIVVGHLIYTWTIFKTFKAQYSKVSWKPVACDNTSQNHVM